MTDAILQHPCLSKLIGVLHGVFQEDPNNNNSILKKRCVPYQRWLVRSVPACLPRGAMVGLLACGSCRVGRFHLVCVCVGAREHCVLLVHLFVACLSQNSHLYRESSHFALPKRESNSTFCARRPLLLMGLSFQAVNTLCWKSLAYCATSWTPPSRGDKTEAC